MKKSETSNIIAALCLLLCILTVTIGAKSNTEQNSELTDSNIRILTEELRETNKILSSVDENIAELNENFKKTGSHNYSAVLNRIADSIKHKKDTSPETVVELLHRR